MFKGDPYIIWNADNHFWNEVGTLEAFSAVNDIMITETFEEYLHRTYKNTFMSYETNPLHLLQHPNDYFTDIAPMYYTDTLLLFLMIYERIKFDRDKNEIKNRHACLDELIFYFDYISEETSRTIFFLTHSDTIFYRYSVYLVRNEQDQIIGLRHANFEYDWYVNEQDGTVTEVVYLDDVEETDMPTTVKPEYNNSTTTTTTPIPEDPVPKNVTYPIETTYKYFCRLLKRDKLCVTVMNTFPECTNNCDFIDCARNCHNKEDCAYMNHNANLCYHYRKEDNCHIPPNQRDDSAEFSQSDLYQCDDFDFVLFPHLVVYTTTAEPIPDNE
eukprot:UN29070